MSPFTQALPWVLILVLFPLSALCLGMLGGPTPRLRGMDPTGPSGCSHWGEWGAGSSGVTLNSPVLIRGGWGGTIPAAGGEGGHPLDWRTPIPGPSSTSAFSGAPHIPGVKLRGFPPPKILGCPPGPDEEPHEVDLGVLILRDHHLVAHPRRRRPGDRQKGGGGVKPLGEPQTGRNQPQIRVWGGGGPPHL